MTAVGEIRMLAGSDFAFPAALLRVEGGGVRGRRRGAPVEPGDGACDQVVDMRARPAPGCGLARANTVYPFRIRDSVTTPSRTARAA